MDPRDYTQGDLIRIRTALAAACDLVYEWDLRSDGLTWFGDVAGVLGLAASEAPADHDALKGRINPQDLPQRLVAFSDHLAGGETLDCEYRLRIGDGSFCWVHERGAVERDEEGHAVRFAGVLRVVDQRKQHEAQLEYIANFDELTGFFNRKRLLETVGATLVQAQRYQDAGCLMVIGIDRLGIVQEAYGHDAVEAAILAAGQRIETCLRNTDVVGRIASDRFGVLLTRCPATDIEKVHSKLLSTFRQFPLTTPLGSFPVTVAVGTVPFPTLSTQATEVMGKAELAMEQARARGSDRAVTYVWSEETQAAHRQNVVVGEQVLHALRDSRLAFAFQPVIHAGTGEVSFYEALMRMRLPNGDILPAGQFVQAVEALGFHRLLDEYGLDLAIAELRRNGGLHLAINISSLTLSDSGWLRRLSGQLKHRRSLAERLIIEITETAAMQDLEDSARFVKSVRELGCRVAIDDFGSGYTSFRQLNALTVDLLKIDGSFIRNVRTNPSNLLFVRTLLDLARGFSLETVAEFIESQEDADFLTAEGVTFLQGYHFGKPDLNPPWRASEPAFSEAGSLELGRLVIPRARRSAAEDRLGLL